MSAAPRPTIDALAHAPGNAARRAAPCRRGRPARTNGAPGPTHLRARTNRTRVPSSISFEGRPRQQRAARIDRIAASSPLSDAMVDEREACAAAQPLGATASGWPPLTASGRRGRRCRRTRARPARPGAPRRPASRSTCEVAPAEPHVHARGRRSRPRSPPPRPRTRRCRRPASRPRPRSHTRTSIPSSAHARELHVGALGEQLVTLERGTDVLHVVALRVLVHEQDQVRVAHRHRARRHRAGRRPDRTAGRRNVSHAGPRIGIGAFVKPGAPIATVTRSHASRRADVQPQMLRGLRASRRRPRTSLASSSPRSCSERARRTACRCRTSPPTSRRRCVVHEERRAGARSGARPDHAVGADARPAVAQRGASVRRRAVVRRRGRRPSRSRCPSPWYFANASSLTRRPARGTPARRRAPSIAPPAPPRRTTGSADRAGTTPSAGGRGCLVRFTVALHGFVQRSAYPRR